MVKRRAAQVMVLLFAAACGAPTLTFSDEQPISGTGGSTMTGGDAAAGADTSSPPRDASTSDAPSSGDTTSD